MFKFNWNSLVCMGLWLMFALCNATAEQERGKPIELYAIAIQNKVKEVDGYFVTLLLKNVSDKNILVLTTSGFDEVMMSRIDENGTAIIDVNPPPHAEFSKLTGITDFENIKFPKEIFLPVKLNPNQHTRLMSAVWVETKNKEFKVRLNISEEFSSKYGLWSGSIECKPTFVSQKKAEALQIKANELWWIRVWREKEWAEFKNKWSS